jgi:hypothetical protein
MTTTAALGVAEPPRRTFPRMASMILVQVVKAETMTMGDSRRGSL